MKALKTNRAAIFFVIWNFVVIYFYITFVLLKRVGG